MRNNNVLKLTESAILLALSVALSFVQFGKLPYGGSITPASMLPLMLISVKHGPRWGLIPAFLYSWFQILQGGVFGWGLTTKMLLASIFLDYILAFTVLGLAGIFRKHGIRGILCGIIGACILRFLVHFLSGIVLWANLEEFVAFGESWVNRPVLYSLVYNGSYMLPETLICIAVAVLLLGIPQTRRFFISDNT